MSTAQNNPLTQGNLFGRVTETMQDPQVKEQSEIQAASAPVQGSRTKSRFDDAEYQRWSESLRAKRSNKK